MKTLDRLSLLDPQSTEGFKSISVSGECDSVNWSVRSYVLRGGLQEGVQVVELSNGKFTIGVLPTRGMGIWKGHYGAMRLGWDSPVKDPVNPAFINAMDRGGIGWLKGFNEWIVRCGLNSMGAPGIDTVLDYSGNEFEVALNLHGNIANVPARAVSVEVTNEAIVIYGEVDETMMFGPALRLNTEMRMELKGGKLTIHDTVTNLGDNPVEHELLYHINYGEPLLEEGARMVTPFQVMAPRDARAAEGVEHYDAYTAPAVGFVEQAYFFDLVSDSETGESITMLRNAAGDLASVVSFAVKDFPCFTLWKNPAGKADGYVTGLEPATAFPNPRNFERTKGRVILLAGGESRSTKLVIENLDDKAAIDDVEATIAKMQQTVQPIIHAQPIPAFSDLPASSAEDKKGYQHENELSEGILWHHDVMSR